eukprot:2795026-Rhodomonas_salina.1
MCMPDTDAGMGLRLGGVSGPVLRAVRAGTRERAGSISLYRLWTVLRILDVDYGAVVLWCYAMSYARYMPSPVLTQVCCYQDISESIRDDVRGGVSGEGGEEGQTIAESIEEGPSLVAGGRGGQSQHTRS